MPEWPMYVYMAADVMGYRYDEPGGEAPVEAFAARWGGFGSDALIRALRAAEGDEWLFTMHLLIYSALPQAREDVVPYLASSDPLERWYSALYLGGLQDIRALPVLCTMLTEFLPAPEAYPMARNQQWRFEDARGAIAYSLGKMGDPSCVPALRQALQAVLSIEEAQLSPAHGEASPLERWHHDAALYTLHRYQDALVYALGQLGAFGALVGLGGIEDRTDVWRVHLVMGSLHDQPYHVAHLVRFEDEPALLSAVTSLLTHQFGLTAAEQVQHLARYEITKLHQVSNLHTAEEMERARRRPNDLTSDQ